MDKPIVTSNKRIESIHINQSTLPDRTWITICVFRSRKITLKTDSLKQYTARFDENQEKAARRTLRGLRLLSASLKRQVTK